MRNNKRDLAKNKKAKPEEKKGFNVFSTGSGNVINIGKKFSNNINVHGKGVKLNLADGSSVDFNDNIVSTVEIKDGLLVK